MSLGWFPSVTRVTPGKSTGVKLMTENNYVYLNTFQPEDYVTHRLKKRLTAL
jgi:hypothetical protein